MQVSVWYSSEEYTTENSGILPFCSVNLSKEIGKTCLVRPKKQNDSQTNTLVFRLNNVNS